MTKNNHPEFDFQCSVASFFTYALPDNIFWTSIPGGALGGGTQAHLREIRLRQSGYRKGAPDLFMIYQGRAILFECKSQTGRVSDDQKSVHDLITTSGGIVIVIKTLEEVEEFLKTVLNIPLRATIKNNKLFDQNNFRIATGRVKKPYAVKRPSKRSIKRAIDWQRPG